MYDFGEVIDRRGSDSTKWDYRATPNGPQRWDAANPEHGEDQVLAMWVADMDFRCAPGIIDAIKKRADHGIFGYSAASESFDEAVTQWFAKRHDWQIDREHIVRTAGVVPALHFAVRAFCQAGDKVLVQRPVYYPFFRAIKNGGCEIVSNDLINVDGHYAMDFDDLERKCADPAVTLAILCSPHNPVGRIWTAAELTRFGEICSKHGVRVIADEIHGDLILPGQSFCPYGTLAPALSEAAIICTAATKTFNLAGLHLSNIVMANAADRALYKQTMVEVGMSPGLDPLALAGIEAAYRQGDDWLDAMLVYLDDNRRLFEDFCRTHLPGTVVSPLQGTYLIWVDFRSWQLTHEDLDALMLEEAKLYLDTGTLFGDLGSGFQRFNIACPRSILQKALDRLRQVAVARKIVPA